MIGALRRKGFKTLDDHDNTSSKASGRHDSIVDVIISTRKSKYSWIFLANSPFLSIQLGEAPKSEGGAFAIRTAFFIVNPRTANMLQGVRQLLHHAVLRPNLSTILD
ncbi:hypothetical protein FRX31_024760 [Thalictrum thalictroides]|uniref:Uncharacterized protein n=1 Tax=Thalictrum thalictroides TaxID=46969 RepID=A0A7J6VL59_THATH|nr:hypothetical protein FRX31_024760 [Thalictrum thalictroides]